MGVRHRRGIRFFCTPSLRLFIHPFFNRATFTTLPLYVSHSLPSSPPIFVQTIIVPSPAIPVVFLCCLFSHPIPVSTCMYIFAHVFCVFLVVVFMVAAFSYLYLHRHLRRCLAAGRMHFAYTITLKTSTTTTSHDVQSLELLSHS